MIRALTFGVWLAGAAALAVAPFLNWYDVALTPPGGETLARDTEAGWVAQPVVGAALLGIAAASAAGIAGTYLSGARWMPVVSSALAAVGVALALYAIGSPPDGELGTIGDATQSFFDVREEFDATVGLGVALGGAAAILAASIGAVVTATGSGARKRCPDCAKNVAAQARVCRFCGYRFT